jgi:ATP-binding cassette subfamily B protein RaxB
MAFGYRERLNLSGFRRLPLVRQAESAECGLACLAMVAGWFGYDTDLLTLRRRFPISLKGTSLRDLIDIAARIGLAARAVRCELAGLEMLRAPCILHWDFSHFVVLRKVRGNRVWVHDPACGERLLKLSEISGSFTGVALELAPADGFAARRERQSLRMGQLFSWQPQSRAALLRAVLLSLVIELFVLLMPFYSQLVVDQAILKSDADLLVALALGFGLVCLFNTAAAALRGLVIQFLANMVSYDMGARLLRQLLALPLDFFQKRQLGDLLQRFQSIGPIKQFIVTGGVAALLDGVLSVVTLTIVLLYSVKLGLLVLASVLLYVTLRAIVMSIARRYAADAMVSAAREQSQFLETIRAIQTIKATGGEATRESEWLNLYIAELNASIRVGNLGIGYQGLSSMLNSASDILVMFLAAKAIMSAEMTIGVMTAFLSYKGQFMSRVMSLADQVIVYRLLDVQLERVADIALSPPEAGSSLPADHDPDFKGELEMRDVTFRYSPTERPVLDGVNLHIAPGEFVAISGQSGEGKSTLVKVLLGLYSQDSGDVFIDGRPMRETNPLVFRRSLGIVMQDDQLLRGSLADNIALFERSFDMDRVRECARQAQIDEEIMTLPMRYHTLVGDLGASLSAGQRQRVLLARALYRRPRVLILDEGTVNVGQECEERIIAMLRALPITRIVVAHSPHVIRAAGRVIRMQRGRVMELSVVSASAEDSLRGQDHGAGARLSDVLEEGTI